MTRAAALCALTAAMSAAPASAQQIECAGRIVPVSYNIHYYTSPDHGLIPAGTRFFVIYLRNQDAGKVAFGFSSENFPNDVQSIDYSFASKHLYPSATQGYQFARTMNANSASIHLRWCTTAVRAVAEGGDPKRTSLHFEARRAPRMRTSALSHQPPCQNDEPSQERGGQQDADSVGPRQAAEALAPATLDGGTIHRAETS
ncbi:hypothetical protein [Sabulicella rubraurantiaca]|uniref:hypothetical protein n=1 Tax=Sabulicella rubraurantiaca TaxID=2811429 RepID=UPI001A96FF29|nr:hypothetical protein [Sabulicella rubraurantiaca]